MSTHKSQNLNLHLWEPNDNFLRTEFNENFAAIDEAVAQAGDTAEEALKLPYVMGAYHGKGNEAFDVYVGFKPSFLLIFANQKYINGSSAIGKVSAFGQTVTSGSCIVLTSTGFRVNAYETAFPSVNDSLSQYEFIAFR